MSEIRGRKVHPWPGKPLAIEYGNQTIVSLGYVDEPRSYTKRCPVWPIEELAARYELSAPQIELLRRHNPDGVIEGEIPAMWPLGDA